MVERRMKMAAEARPQTAVVALGADERGLIGLGHHLGVHVQVLFLQLQIARHGVQLGRRVGAGEAPRFDQVALDALVADEADQELAGFGDLGIEGLGRLQPDPSRQLAERHLEAKAEAAAVARAGALPGAPASNTATLAPPRARVRAAESPV